MSGGASSFTAYSFFLQGIAISACLLHQADLNYIAKLRAIQFPPAKGQAGRFTAKSPFAALLK